MKRIKMSNCRVSVVVDGEDYYKLLRFKNGRPRKWCLSNGYATSSKTLMHRLLVGAKAGQFVDHKNRNKLDNRKQNLRICTIAENNYNKELKHKTKGVHLEKKSNKFIARIGYRYQRFYLGRYARKCDALSAYNKKAIELFGEYAYLNTIEPIVVIV